MPTAEKIDTLVSIHTGQPAQIVAIEHAATRQEMPYCHGTISVDPDWEQLADKGAQVSTTRYVPDTLFAEPAGSIENAVEPVDSQPVARFGDCLSLQSANVEQSRGKVEIELVWQQECATPAEFTVFAHLLADEGALLAQADGDPLSGILPFSLWPEYPLVYDKRFAILQNHPTYISVGLYDRYTGDRLPGYTAEGVPLTDNTARNLTD